MNLAPIILFVYNRPWHTKQTLEALMLNDYADQSTLYIYCDGPKEDASEENLKSIEEVREVIREMKWCKEVIIKERTENLGLANSIIQGVTSITEKHGKVIVLEDDIVTSTGFLKYMNDALDFYQHNEKVMHISGYMYPNKEQLPETFFFNVPLCWGWATWDRAWKFFNNDAVYLWNEIHKRDLLLCFDKFGGDYLSSQLAHNISGRLKTWFIKWHASVLLYNGYTLYPSISLVDNIGFDNTGVHNGENPQFKNDVLSASINLEKIDFVEDKTAEKVIYNFYQNLKYNKANTKPNILNIKKFIKRKIRSLFFLIFPDVKNLIQKTNKINNSEIIQNKTYLGKSSKIYPKAKLSNSVIGNYTYIAENSIINNAIIGKFCSIGPNLIAGWGIHPTNGISTHPMFYSNRKQNGMTLSLDNKIEEILPINIGNDVFIGMNVIVLDGVTIGDGAVIGAGAVVSKNIPAFAIAVGCPIKIIGFRFNNEIIEKLLNIKWWDFNDEDLPLIEKHFFDINEYLRILEEKNSKIDLTDI